MDERVRDALAAVPRKDFLPKRQQAFAHHDTALDIGYGATNSQPTTVRNMLGLLDPRPGDRVLDLGSGSCWTTGLLAHLVGPEGEVVAVELVPEVLRIGRANLGDRFPRVSLHLAREGVLGWPEDAPYDRILVSAGARHVPEELVRQLTPMGVMVIPVNGVMLRVTRTPTGHQVEKHGRYSFVPLVGG